MAEMVLPRVDYARCTGCGRCVALCPGTAVALHQGQPVFVNPSACTYCGVCEDHCPTGALALVYEIQRPPRGHSFA